MWRGEGCRGVGGNLHRPVREAAEGWRKLPPAKNRNEKFAKKSSKLKIFNYNMHANYLSKEVHKQFKAPQQGQRISMLIIPIRGFKYSETL